MQATLRKISFSWDRGRHLLWACVETTSGDTLKVGFPLAQVELLFTEELQREGIPAAPRVGGYPDTTEFCRWADGLGRRYDGEAVGACHPPVLGDIDLITYDEDELDEPSVGGLFKKLRKRAKRAFKRTVKRVGRRAKGFLRRTGRLAKKAIRSKALGWAVRGAAVAFPAVGGPALAALTAARAGMSAVNTAKRAMKSARRVGQSARAVMRGRRVLSQIRRLKGQNTTRAHLLRSAFQATRA